MASSPFFGPISPCFATSETLLELVDCFDGYTVPWYAYNEQTYEDAQPTGLQRVAFKNTILSMLSVQLFCPSVDKEIEAFYSANIYIDLVARLDYCVLSEIAPVREDGSYSKGWGIFIVPRYSKRDLHFSAPHPAYDLNTPQQSAVMFQSTDARSLLIPGRSRLALANATDCITPISNTTMYYKTDPAHDTYEPFFDASVAIYEYQMSQGGWPSRSCAFIQMHGKATTTCFQDSVFLSSGLGSKDASWYRNNSKYPVSRIRNGIKKFFPNFIASLPSDDTSCSLTATTNVVGRVLNNIDPADVCNAPTTAKGATGMFVHIEQSAPSRDPSVYQNWTWAFEDAFRTIGSLGK